MIKISRNYKLLGVNDPVPQDAAMASAAPVAWWPDGSVRTYQIAQYLDLGGVKVINYDFMYWDTDQPDAGGKVDWNGFASFYMAVNLPEDIVAPRGLVKWGIHEVKSYHINVNGVTDEWASSFPYFGNYIGGIGWYTLESIYTANLFKQGVNNINITADTFGDFSANDWLRWLYWYTMQPALGVWLELSWEYPFRPTADDAAG